MKTMRLLFVFISLMFIHGCSKPVDPLSELDRVALVAIYYDPTIYMYSPIDGINYSRVYAKFSGDHSQRQTHKMILNEYITDLMTSTVEKSGISIVRPLNLLNTTLMSTDDSKVRYEYL